VRMLYITACIVNCSAKSDNNILIKILNLLSDGCFKTLKSFGGRIVLSMGNDIFL